MHASGRNWSKGHILKMCWPANKMGNEKDGPLLFWRWLRMFWPLGDLQEPKIYSREMENILPLRVDTHQLLDRHHFTLRPIKHEDDPSHRIYIQMVWLNALDTEGGGLSWGNWNHGEPGTIVDGRRISSDPYAFVNVKHGDVYNPETERGSCSVIDPNAVPLCGAQPRPGIPRAKEGGAGGGGGGVETPESVSMIAPANTDP
ncbi:hypothetical protein B0T25DRAFT_60886 [Lasiosphaeria hispida]|uniref:Uncharacterized protein n=1 Tax=Lasiosphaeria hispida TaxID=260671 RepID=A0AAJ0MKY3_9PEZI|nr:hypothetical protein B0T25DRAFT_60886 [Lasiosphaeria hispida]